MRLVLPHCTLRDWRATDADALARHANDRDIWLNLRDAFPHPYRLEDAHRFLAMVAKQSPTTYFAIEVDGEAAGSVGLALNTDVERLSAEFGYWLARPYWGRGITTEAVRAFALDRMREHGLVRLYAKPYARNGASCRVLEKAGFQLEGTLSKSAIKDGVVLDQRLYALVRAEPMGRARGC